MTDPKAWTAAQRQEIITRGYFTIPEWISPETLEQIQSELATWLRQISWSDTSGYALISGDKWLLHLGLCSKTIMDAMLDERILDFMAGVFGEEPVLAEVSLHHSTRPNPDLPFHSDRDGGIIVYLFLSDMTADNGQLSVIPGTQNNIEHFYIPAHDIEAKRENITPLFAKAGDVIVFDQDIWHRRSPGGSGRSVVKAMYHAQSRLDGAVDHMLRQSLLAGLTQRQLRCLGIGLPAFGRTGHFRKLGRRFWKADLKAMFYYLISFPHIGRSSETRSYDTYIASKMHDRPRKIRSG